MNQDFKKKFNLERTSKVFKIAKTNSLENFVR